MATPALNETVHRRIEQELAAGTSHRDIVKKLHVSMGTVSNIATGLKEPSEVSLANQKQRIKEVEAQYRDALETITQLRSELSEFTNMQAWTERFKPVEITPKHGGKGEATAIVCVNDWHYEETVTKEAVNGVNEYNLDVAKRRAATLWASAASLVDMCRSRSRIDTIIVNVLGDMISGYIHDELAATNSLTPIEATLAVFDTLVSGLEFLKKETKAKEIIVPCICGNHSRFTKKRWAKRGPGVSFEGMLYGLMVRWFLAHNEKVIRIVPPQGDMTYYKVYGRTIRVMHGDGINYMGGIGRSSR